MITVYQVKKEKSNVRGYWKDDKGKLHVDNIQLKFIQPENIDQVLAQNYGAGELAVFYVSNGTAYIASQCAENIELKTCNFKAYKILTHSILKSWIEKFGGCTVFNTKAGYQVEAWSN